MITNDVKILCKFRKAESAKANITFEGIIIRVSNEKTNVVTSITDNVT